ncbi:hypothetical protein [Salinispora fenicalii]|uniref:hypothetical protein n=1 Tax=Salinispora fenicalii TaxID=1137263 RepID=UPI0037CBC50E
MRRDLIASLIGVLVGLALSWLVLATAQGGNRTPDPVTWGHAPTPAAQSTVFGVVALMWSAGCGGGAQIALDPGRYEMGTCTMGGGDEVTVAVFAPGAAQSGWVDSMRQFGAVVVEGDRWAVASLTATAPAEFAAAVPN